MWAWLSGLKKCKGIEKLSETHKTVSVNEEYLGTLRTKSYVKFFIKAQQFASDSSETKLSNAKELETLLEPEQELIPSVLQNLINPKALSGLELLLANYFDTSAEASKICSQLLRNIKSTNSNYQTMDSFLEGFSNSPPEQMSLEISALESFVLRSNPFSKPNRRDFKRIHDKYSSMSETIKMRHKKVTRQIKLIRGIKKLSGACLMMVCGVVALVAIGIAVHSFSGLLLGPALLGLSPMSLENKVSSFKKFETKFPVKLREKLDVTAKGTYILGRDFDTVSQLVAHLSDGIEHENAMMRYCMERIEHDFPVQAVVKELRKTCCRSRMLTEELEEHVCLCLATINRARVLVIKQISEET